MSNLEQTACGREMANWLHLLGMKQLITVIESDVNDDKRKQVYSDGQTTIRDVGKLIDVDHSTIGDWWKKWILLGLGEHTIASGGHQFKKTFDLESMEIITNQKPRKQSNTQTEQGEIERHE